MIRALLRLVLVLIVVALAIAFLMGYRLTRPDGTSPSAGQAIGRTEGVDATRAREASAAVRDKVAAGAIEAQRAIGNAALTGKIKAKMALDDTIKDVDVNVDTAGGAVTLRGTVHTEAERARVLQLARETAGVTSVNDRLTVR